MASPPFTMIRAVGLQSSRAPELQSSRASGPQGSSGLPYAPLGCTCSWSGAGAMIGRVILLSDDGEPNAVFRRRVQRTCVRGQCHDEFEGATDEGSQVDVYTSTGGQLEYWAGTWRYLEEAPRRPARGPRPCHVVRRWKGRWQAAASSFCPASPPGSTFT